MYIFKRMLLVFCLSSSFSIYCMEDNRRYPINENAEEMLNNLDPGLTDDTNSYRLFISYFFTEKVYSKKSIRSFTEDELIRHLEEALNDFKFKDHTDVVNKLKVAIRDNFNLLIEQLKLYRDEEDLIRKNQEIYELNNDIEMQVIQHSINENNQLNNSRCCCIIL